MNAITADEVREQVGDIGLNDEAVTLVAAYLSGHPDPETVDVEAAYEYAALSLQDDVTPEWFAADFSTSDPGVLATVTGLDSWLRAGACSLCGAIDCQPGDHDASEARDPATDADLLRAAADVLRSWTGGLNTTIDTLDDVARQLANLEGTKP